MNVFLFKTLDAENAHRSHFCTKEQLNQILSIQTRRILSKNLDFSFESQVYQVSTPNVSNRLKHKAVTVCQMMDGAINVTWNQMNLMVETLPINKKNFNADTKEIKDVVETIIFQYAIKQNLKIANL
ncbi:MAG: hypothetical protein Q8K36_03110 [Alphaproteobacteria bacterium]|nr:hypothetical protein [Alphaproteobacteria bacterium]